MWAARRCTRALWSERRRYSSRAQWLLDSRRAYNPASAESKPVSGPQNRRERFWTRSGPERARPRMGRAKPPLAREVERARGLAAQSAAGDFEPIDDAQRRAMCRNPVLRFST